MVLCYAFLSDMYIRLSSPFTNDSFLGNDPAIETINDSDWSVSLRVNEYRWESEVLREEQYFPSAKPNMRIRSNIRNGKSRRCITLE